jgi:hypothetical protein
MEVAHCHACADVMHGAKLPIIRMAAVGGARRRPRQSSSASSTDDEEDRPNKLIRRAVLAPTFVASKCMLMLRTSHRLRASCPPNSKRSIWTHTSVRSIRSGAAAGAKAMDVERQAPAATESTRCAASHEPVAGPIVR